MCGHSDCGGKDTARAQVSKTTHASPWTPRGVVRPEVGVRGQPLRGGIEVKFEVLEGHEAHAFAVDEGGEVLLSAVYASAVKAG